jgi:hypothetical protein
MTAATLLVWTAMAMAQVPVASTAPSAPARFQIEDNSFLVEEALNQEPGIFQNIVVFTRTRGNAWSGSFTQEWPLGSQRHQGSITVPFSYFDGSGDVGNVLLNYRLQVTDGGDGRPAFSPRVSVVGRRGWQVNLPVSQQAGRVYLHGNVGNTWISELGDWASTPFVAGSIIYAARPMLNLMLEAYSEWQPAALAGAGRARATTIAPGLRGGWNVGDAQVILGLAVPITRGDVRDHGVLGYLSYELPFKR